MKADKKSITAGVCQCALFVALMAAAAYIQIPFPLVPLTFQTVVSVLAGLLLGAKKGAISMSVYALMGLIGLPVFSGGGGIYYVLKPSFGYIIGFILAAFIAGALSAGSSYSLKKYVFAAVCAFLADYLIGIPYCIICARLLGVNDLLTLLITGNLIYIPKDAVMCVLAAVIACKVSPFISSDLGKRG